MKTIELIRGSDTRANTSLTATFNGNVSNVVVGRDNTISIYQQAKRKVEKYPDGCIGCFTVKANYVSHLI